ncbi:MAG: pilin [bacterium]
MTKNQTITLGLLGAFVLGVIIFSGPIVQAAPLPNPLGSANDIPGLIGRIINVILSLVGTGALLMFVYGGARYIFSRGEAEEVGTAKNILVWSALGLIVIFVAYAIVNFLVTGLVGIKSNTGTTGTVEAPQTETSSTTKTCPGGFTLNAAGDACVSESGATLPPTEQVTPVLPETSPVCSSNADCGAICSSQGRYSGGTCSASRCTCNFELIEARQCNTNRDCESLCGVIYATCDTSTGLCQNCSGACEAAACALSCRGSGSGFGACDPVRGCLCE